MSLTPRQPEHADSLVVDEERINELGIKVHKSHVAVLNSGRDMVEHALETGAALLEARTVVPRGEWTAWLRNNAKVSVSTAYNYERLALNADKLIAGISAGQPLHSISACTRFLNPPELRPMSEATAQRMISQRKKMALYRVEIDDEMIESTAQWFIANFPRTFARMPPARRKVVSEKWAASILLKIFKKGSI